MELSQAIELITRGVTSTQLSTWADLGSGAGVFTHALASLLVKGSTIYAIDTDPHVLMKISAPPDVQLHKLVADFEKDAINLPQLDGILLANSLHFVKDKAAFIKKAAAWLEPGGCIIIVEYNTNKANRWVPYPISFVDAQKLFSSLECSAELIGEAGSTYNKEGMYGVKVNLPNLPAP